MIQQATLQNAGNVMREASIVDFSNKQESERHHDRTEYLLGVIAIGLLLFGTNLAAQWISANHAWRSREDSLSHSASYLALAIRERLADADEIKFSSASGGNSVRGISRSTGVKFAINLCGDKLMLWLGAATGEPNCSTPGGKTLAYNAAIRAISEVCPIFARNADGKVVMQFDIVDDAALPRLERRFMETVG